MVEKTAITKEKLHHSKVSACSYTHATHPFMYFMNQNEGILHLVPLVLLVAALLGSEESES